MHLDSNPAEYLKYLEWKTSYEVLNSKEDINKAFCRLCAQLHTKQKPRSLDNLEDWWVTQSHCKQ